MRLLRIVTGAFFAITMAVTITSHLTAQPAKKVVKKTVAKKAPVAKVLPPKKMPGTRVLVSTDSGDMVIRLYDSTPLHRDNFIAKVKEGFYDSLLFHRVINGFMIQGGDPNSKYAKPGEMLGMGSAPGDRIPAEFRPTLFHKKGVLAAARDGNPEKASSNCQFYIVQGKKLSDQEINMQGRAMSPAQKIAYKTIGGTPFLDQNYTVYGEVEIGMKVIDKLATVPTAPGDRPINDLRMRMRILTDDELDGLLKKEMNNSVKKSVMTPIPSKNIKKKTK